MLVALLCLSSWCLMNVVWHFLMMLQVCLQFVIVVFPDQNHLLFCLSIDERLRAWCCVCGWAHRL